MNEERAGLIRLLATMVVFALVALAAGSWVAHWRPPKHPVSPQPFSSPPGEP